MLKSKQFYLIGVMLGLCLLTAGIVLNIYAGDSMRAVTGVCLGAGVSLVMGCLSNLRMKNIEAQRPEIARQSKIDYQDERNTFIRNKAKAKAADIAQWISMAAAYVNILLDGNIWLTLLIVASFAVYHLAALYFTGKYQKEM